MNFRAALRRSIGVGICAAMVVGIPSLSFAEGEGVGTEYSWKCDSGETTVVAVHPTDGEVMFYGLKNMGSKATTFGDYRRMALSIGARSYRAAEKGVLFSWANGELKRHHYDFESKEWTETVAKFPGEGSLSLGALGVGTEGHLYSIENGWLTHSQFDAGSKHVARMA